MRFAFFYWLQDSNISSNSSANHCIFLNITVTQAFNGKKWEKFNSEKVATLAYARIQGKAALVAHFQHTSLMNEDKCCRPILFDSEFPESNDKVKKPTSGL